MRQTRACLQSALRLELMPPALALEMACTPPLCVGLRIENALWLPVPFPLWLLSAYAGVGARRALSVRKRASRCIRCPPASPVWGVRTRWSYGASGAFIPTGQKIALLWERVNDPDPRTRT